VRDWPAPDFGVEKHRIYMFQWYAFAALALVLWLALNLRRRGPVPMTDAPSPPRPRMDARGRRTLLLIAAVAIAPVIASYAIYYLFPRTAQVNYGTLLPTAPRPRSRARSPAERRSVSGICAGAGCCWQGVRRAAAASAKRPSMRRGRRARCRAKDQDRIARVWLDAGGATPPPDWASQDPGLIVARIPAATLAALPGAHGIWLVDPLGNLVLGLSADPDIKGLAKDLARLPEGFQNRLAATSPAVVKFALRPRLPPRRGPGFSMTTLALAEVRFRQFLALAKPRVVSLIVFVAMIGMFLAVPGCRRSCRSSSAPSASRSSRARPPPSTAWSSRRSTR